MLNSTEKYCIIREYKGNFDLEELMKRIIRIHVKNEVNKGCSDHEVQYEK